MFLILKVKNISKGIFFQSDGHNKISIIEIKTRKHDINSILVTLLIAHKYIIVKYY